MVVDTSALVAILRGEPEREAFLDVLAATDDVLISAATLLECSIVQSKFEEGVGDLDDLLESAGVRCVAVDAAQALAAREAWMRYGKGRSVAGLNYGDCFSYALATTMSRPLLFKGADFTHTDVARAL